MTFPTDYTDVLERLADIDPIEYGITRNYVDGAVTRLSPYVSRGVISTKQILQSVFDRGFRLEQIEPFVKELCWRDYFQRVSQERNVSIELKSPQSPVANNQIPANIVRATTGIHELDNAITELYQTGYMHNHCRMYTASIACNISRSHWYVPAKWMYYHLLDGDWASNACSWQWVAGSNSHKKYYANQENINTYTHTQQTDTFLDRTYEDIEVMGIPSKLTEVVPFSPTVVLPTSDEIHVDASLPTMIYNYYNLDPLWRRTEDGNRILLLEPTFFNEYPISKRCVDFMLELSTNIPNIQIYVGSFASYVQRYHPSRIYYKEHPLNVDYSGTVDQRDWIEDRVTGYYPSFSAYWRVVEKHIHNLFATK